MLAAHLLFAKTQTDAGDAVQRYEYYRVGAVRLHQRAAQRSIEDVKFVATPQGIIVVGNYVPWAICTPRGPDNWGDDEADEDLLGVPLRATEYDAGDPKIIDAISQRALFADLSLIRRQHEDGDAETIQKPARYVMLLTLHGPVAPVPVTSQIEATRVDASRDSREFDWLVMNYDEGVNLLREPNPDHGRSDTDGDIAKELGLGRSEQGQQVDENAEGDGTQHRNEADEGDGFDRNETDEDDGGRGFEIVDPK